LLDVEVASLEQASVGRHQVPGDQADDVAGHELPPGNLDPGPVPEDRSGRGQRLAQPFDGPLRTVRLEEIDRDPNKHDRHNDGSVEDLTEERRYQARDQKNEDERVSEQGQELVGHQPSFDG
jgi:hypothetical protein